MNKIPITKAGYKRVEEEHKVLKFNERPAVIDQIAEAREHEDLKENAEYHAAREKQSFIEGRIQELENIIANGQVIDPAETKSDRIVFGATIELINDETEEEITYQIVGEYEGDLDKGKISVTSPIAKALIGKEEGDIVKVVTPGGGVTYEVDGVKYV